LSKAILTGATLVRSGLRRTDLQNADVGTMKIYSEDGRETGRAKKTNFQSANMTGANTSGLDLSSCEVVGLVKDESS
jgi:uncharacterized protein YjbI with pentapeptide repeats